MVTTKKWRTKKDLYKIVFENFDEVDMVISLNDFAKHIGAEVYKVESLPKSNNSEVYRVTTSKGDFVYKVRTKPNSIKATNEVLALQFLTQVFPKEDFYPRYVWSNEFESALTFLNGDLCFPAQLSKQNLEVLASIVEKLSVQASSPFFTTEKIDNTISG